VTNGYRRSHDEDILNIADMGAVGRDPIRTFWDRNWLLPGSYLCRTDRVGLDLFDGMPECLECTYLALRLAISYRVKFLQLPTVIWDQRTPDSLSKSREFALSQSAAHERLLELDLPPYARQKVLERIALNFHSISGLHLREGDRLKAWYSHLQSLVRRGGYRYLPYTRRLLFAMVAPRRETR
jgi:hypothetical protein